MLSQQSLEGERLRYEVTQRGYAEFEHGISGDAFDHLVGTYAEFTLAHPDPQPETMNQMLPESNDNIDRNLDELDRAQDSQSEWHKYRTNVPGVGKPYGYSNRSFQIEALRHARGVTLDEEDRKEFYHYTPIHYAAMARMHRAQGWGPIPNEVARLDTAFRVIHQKASGLMLKVCTLIEETHPEIHDIINPTSLLTSPIRLVLYHPTTAKLYGGGHYDKSAATLQLAESHEGLYVATNKDEPLNKVVRDADKAVFFAADALLKQVADKETPFQPAWHNIVRSDSLNPGRAIPVNAQEVCARYAVIFFANAAKFVDPDKSTMHTR